MKNIDFLPVRFREGYAKRSALRARWTIVLGIATMITPLAIYQYVVHAQAVQSFVHVEPQYVVAQAKARKIAEMEQELTKIHHQAALLAWLGHPWPRSQILAHIHHPLPDTVRLTGIRLDNEIKGAATTVAGGGKSRAARRSTEAQEAALDETRQPAERDLAKLIDEHGQHDCVVTLTGVTVNTAELHTYVAKLRVCGLFEKSELRSLESQPGQEASKGQSFEVRLVLANVHAKGEPEKKKGKSQAAEPIASRREISSPRPASGRGAGDEELFSLQIARRP